MILPLVPWILKPPRIMSIWVREIKRVIENVSQPIQRLWIPRIGHNRIRGDKPPQLRIIPAGVVVAQPLPARQPGLVILAGETFGCQCAECTASIAAIGIVEFLLLHRPRAVNDDTGIFQSIA